MIGSRFYTTNTCGWQRVLRYYSLPPGKVLAAVPGAQNLPELFRGVLGHWEVKAPLHNV